MTKTKNIKREPLGEPRQTRFEPDLEKAILEVVANEGIDFATVVRMATRRGIVRLKKGLKAA